MPYLLYILAKETIIDNEETEKNKEKFVEGKIKIEMK